MRLLNFCLQRTAAVAQICLLHQACEHAAFGNTENGVDGYFNIDTASGKPGAPLSEGLFAPWTYLSRFSRVVS